MDIIRVRHLSHRYNGRLERALQNINLDISSNKVTVLLGSSGSGKSTLLRCINRTIKPEEGSIWVNGDEITDSSVREADLIRRSIGMIFQQFNLIEQDCVLKNVLNGRLGYTSTLRGIVGRFSEQDKEIAYDCLEKVQLNEYADYKVSSLSGGQKQRVAIARALAQKPQIILADEPVSSLDPKLMREIMDLLQTVCQEQGITLVASLHFLNLARHYADHIIGIREGEIVFNDSLDELTDKNLIDIYGETKEWQLYGETGF